MCSFEHNSVRNQFDLLRDIIKNNIDILMIPETKFDSSLRNGQFQIHGYSEPYSLTEMKMVVELNLKKVAFVLFL